MRGIPTHFIKDSQNITISPVGQSSVSNTSILITPPPVITRSILEATSTAPTSSVTRPNSASRRRPRGTVRNSVGAYAAVKNIQAKIAAKCAREITKTDPQPDPKGTKRQLGKDDLEIVSPRTPIKKPKTSVPSDAANDGVEQESTSPSTPKSRSRRQKPIEGFRKNDAMLGVPVPGGLAKAGGTAADDDKFGGGGTAAEGDEFGGDGSAYEGDEFGGGGSAYEGDEFGGGSDREGAANGTAADGEKAKGGGTAAAGEKVEGGGKKIQGVGDRDGAGDGTAAEGEEVKAVSITVGSAAKSAAQAAASSTSREEKVAYNSAGCKLRVVDTVTQTRICQLKIKGLKLFEKSEDLLFDKLMEKVVRGWKGEDFQAYSLCWKDGDKIRYVKCDDSLRKAIYTSAMADVRSMLRAERAARAPPKSKKQSQHPSKKRKADDDDQENIDTRKRTRAEEANNLPAGFFEGGVAVELPVEDEGEPPLPGFVPAQEPDPQIAAQKTSPPSPTPPQPIPNPSPALDDEYAAFSAEISRVPSPPPRHLTALDALNSGTGVISAAPLSATELAAQAREEQSTQREERQEEKEAEREDAARNLEEEFAEMEQLEERVRRLREKRERLRKGLQEGVIGEKVEKGVMVSEVVSNGREDVSEEDDDDDDEGDEWDGWGFGRS
ncbi:hypothetical protein EJ08DRAFT_676094 [Tothia fuscella]|uniref:Uncharacterized protein n=1 Tax=Tothia fuscella TaxID=1048955 RepID=A0A9P4NYQ9_9PEZI|nr:hypothetical protein EJ08DRAFT_676094 [Tothia fuscella]